MCGRGHVLAKGANVGNYPGEQVGCDICGDVIATSDAYSCAACQADLCEYCYQITTSGDADDRCYGQPARRRSCRRSAQRRRPNIEVKAHALGGGHDLLRDCLHTPRRHAQEARRLESGAPRRARADADATSADKAQLAAQRAFSNRSAWNSLTGLAFLALPQGSFCNQSRQTSNCMW